MTRLPLFDSYSGGHLDEVLRQIEERNIAETHREADSEFLRGERSALDEIRQILAAATYARRADGSALAIAAAGSEPRADAGRSPR